MIPTFHHRHAIALFFLCISIPASAQKYVIKVSAFDTAMDVTSIVREPIEALEQRGYDFSIFNDTPEEANLLFFFNEFQRLHIEVGEDSSNLARVPFQAHRHDVFYELMVYPILVSPGGKMMVSIKNKDELARYGEFYLIKARYTESVFTAGMKKGISEKSFEIMILGMVLMMFLYTLSLYFQIRGWEYWYYSLYILSFVIYCADLTFGRSNISWYTGILGYRGLSTLCQLAGYIFYFQFFRYFTNTPIHQPEFDKVLRIASYFIICYLIIHY